jgi:hypothetical protein
MHIISMNHYVGYIIIKKGTEQAYKCLATYILAICKCYIPGIYQVYNSKRTCFFVIYQVYTRYIIVKGHVFNMYIPKHTIHTKYKTAAPCVLVLHQYILCIYAVYTMYKHDICMYIQLITSYTCIHLCFQGFLALITCTRCPQMALRTTCQTNTMKLVLIFKRVHAAAQSRWDRTG